MNVTKLSNQKVDVFTCICYCKHRKLRVCQRTRSVYARCSNDIINFITGINLNKAQFGWANSSRMAIHLNLYVLSSDLCCFFVVVPFPSISLVIVEVNKQSLFITSHRCYRIGGYELFVFQQKLLTIIRRYRRTIEIETEGRELFRKYILFNLSKMLSTFSYILNFRSKISVTYWMHSSSRKSSRASGI